MTYIDESHFSSIDKQLIGGEEATMLFRKKQRLRREYNERLLALMALLNEDWSKQKVIVEKGYEHSDEVIQQYKLAEARYFFLIREAKLRKVSLKK